MKKMIWFISWVLFMSGMFLVAVIFLAADYHDYQASLIVTLVALLPRLFLSAFYLARDICDYFIFGFIIPTVALAGVLWTTNLAFPGHFSLIALIEATVFIVAFFIGLVNYKRVIRAWTENARRILRETSIGKRTLREA
jgi:hypothetical protein